MTQPTRLATGPERVTAEITTTVTDESGDAIAGSSLTTLTLTLYNKSTGAVINSVSETNILNTGRGSVSEAGVLTLTLEPEDMQVVDSELKAGNIEHHVALIVWTWDSGGKRGHDELIIPVRNSLKVTA